MRYESGMRKELYMEVLNNEKARNSHHLQDMVNKRIHKQWYFGDDNGNMRTPRDAKSHMLRRINDRQYKGTNESQIPFLPIRRYHWWLTARHYICTDLLHLKALSKLEQLGKSVVRRETNGLIKSCPGSFGNDVHEPTGRGRFRCQPQSLRQLVNWELVDSSLFHW